LHPQIPTAFLFTANWKDNTGGIREKYHSIHIHVLKKKTAQPSFKYDKTNKGIYFQKTYCMLSSTQNQSIVHNSQTVVKST